MRLLMDGLKRKRYDAHYRTSDLHWHVCGDTCHPSEFTFDPEMGCGAIQRHAYTKIKTNDHRCVRCGRMLPGFRVLPSSIRKHITYLRQLVLSKGEIHA